MVDRADEWAALDEVLGVETVPMPDEHNGTTMASTAAAQPKTTRIPKRRARGSGNARKFVEPLCGRIVAKEGRHRGGRPPYGYLVEDGVCTRIRARPSSQIRWMATIHRPRHTRQPRYTGYAFFGRWTKQKILIDPDDVAASHSVRFRRSATPRVVRSRHPAHPPIVSVKEFTETQLIRKAKAAGGPDTVRLSIAPAQAVRRFACYVD